jgi:hypothetical protein
MRRRCARSPRSRKRRARAARERYHRAVPRSRSATKSTRERIESVPWAALLQVIVVVGRRWRALSQKDRARLMRLARDSRGRWGNLSRKERAEVRKLLGRLELARMGRDLFALRRVRRGRRKR